MFKILTPIIFSGFVGSFFPVSVSWLFLGAMCILSSEFSQSMFYFSSVGKPMVVLSLWVSGMMMYASAPIFSNKKGGWLVCCALFLNLLLVLTFTSQSLISFYFFFESTLVPTLMLILGWGNQPERLQASMYLLLYTVFGSLPLLVGISVISSYDSICLLLPHKVLISGGLFWVALMLGLLVKMPMYPVHLWLPKAHVEAPLAGSMALAGVLLKLGAFGILTVMEYVSCFSGVLCLTVSVCLWGSVVTSVICLRQTDMKGLIAYSSIGHMGLVLAGLVSCTDYGVKGAIVVVVAHGLSSPAMFTFANIVYESSFSRSMVLCKGIVSIFPALAISLLLVCATNMAAPPSINLVGEIWIMICVVGFSSWISVFVGLMSFLVGAYTIYLYTMICHGSSTNVYNPGHLFSGSNHCIMFMQAWPLGGFILSLYSLF